MKRIVVYQSGTGFTAKYAGWIAEDLGCEAKEFKTLKPGELAGYDMVIYGGWIMGGMVAGYDKVKKLEQKNIVVFGVGMTVPSEEFANAFRLLKFFLILVSAWLGLFGYLAGILAILIHLSGLRSFGVPYLLPFASSEADDGAQLKDSIFRFPLFCLRKRPVYAKGSNRIRFRWRDQKQTCHGKEDAYEHRK